MTTSKFAGASKAVATRDFVVFQIKLAIDGVKDIVVFNLSIVAILIDLLVGRRGSARCFYRVVRASRNFDRWLRLHATKGEGAHLHRLSHNLEEGNAQTPAPLADSSVRLRR